MEEHAVTEQPVTEQPVTVPPSETTPQDRRPQKKTRKTVKEEPKEERPDTMDPDTRRHYLSMFIRSFEADIPCRVAREYTLMTYSDGRHVAVQVPSDHVRAMWDRFSKDVGGTRDEYINAVIEAVYLDKIVPITNINPVDLP